MNLKLNRLQLNCRKSVEEVPFGERLSFFHGEMSTGKSSIPALVDFCFGGHFPKTPALGTELLSVRLELSVAGKPVVIERTPHAGAEAQVSWESSNGEVTQCVAPLRMQQNLQRLVEAEVYTLSDLLLHLLGVDVVKVRRRTFDIDSPLVRLSIRDIFEFVYLNQDDLDSDFFLLGIPIRKEKSQDALRYFTGMMSDKLNELQVQLQEARQDQRVKRETVARINVFLAQFDFDSEERISDEIRKLSAEEDRIQKLLDDLKAGYRPEVLMGDEDRRLMSELDRRVTATADSLSELKARVEEQDSLRSELIGLKLKASRVAVAHGVLDDAPFEVCPACGTNLESRRAANGHCYLCSSELRSDTERISGETDIIRQDLDARIEDLRQSLSRHKRAAPPLQTRLGSLRRERQVVEKRINDRLRQYESDFFDRSKNYEKQLSTLQEKIASLKRARAMPAEVRRIQAEADSMAGDIERLRTAIREEESKLVGAERNFGSLEANYKKVLLDIHFPDISPEDYISIDRRTMIPEIVQASNGNRWTFFDIGSGGKKTLLKICFALALHVTAAENGLPVPHLLMIDSPMKNITPDINPEVFRNFFSNLYSLLLGVLKEWQVVLVDQTFFPVPAELQPSYQRLLKRDDPEFPRLIGYYTGS